VRGCQTNLLDLNIANTRGKKILKLFAISKRLIKDYGFFSFIRISFYELKKQRMGIFQPDMTETEHLKFTKLEKTGFDTYKIWLANNLNAFTINDVKEKISNFYSSPFIDLVIICDTNSQQMEYLKDSISSIVNQSYEKWNLLVYFRNFSKDFLKDTFIQDLDKNSKIKFVKDNETRSINDILPSLTGEFTIFVNLGDVLSSNALFHIVNFLNKNQETDVLYTDEDKLQENGERTFPFFKPNWSPYLFLNMDYISRFFVVRKKILDDVGAIREELEDKKMYDLLLRITEKTKKILHLPLPLCSIRDTNHKSSTVNGMNVLKDALKRRKIDCTVQKGMFSDTFRVKFRIKQEPKVSIIIPTRDQKKVLKRCIKSIERKTNYKNFEIIIIDNNSEKEETLSFLDSLPYKVIQFKSPFNFSKMNNLAVAKSSGEYLLFLNDDVAALEPDWLNEMLSICCQNDVGAVGPKLVLANNTIQHGGIAFLKTGSGFHPFQGKYSHEKGYFGFLNVMRDCSAVTAACLLTKRKIFEEIGGFDEGLNVSWSTP